MSTSDYTATPPRDGAALASTLRNIASSPPADQAIRASLLNPAPLPQNVSALTLIELILKDRPTLHQLLRDRTQQAELLMKFLGIAVAGFVLFGVALSIILASAGAWPKLTPLAQVIDDPSLQPVAMQTIETSPSHLPSLASAAGKLIFAYTFGLIAATGICLPSLYFYGLLAGIKLPFIDVTLHALKAKATAAVALVGILPVYVALSLGTLVFDIPATYRTASLLLGLLLPFIGGLWGTYSLYQGFRTLRDTLPAAQREPRIAFLSRLVFSWCGVYTAVCPVMIHAVWSFLGT